MKKKCEEPYTKIPNYIARSSFLSPIAKTLYVAIVSYNPSYPSYSQLAKDTGIKSPTTIRKYLKELLLFDLLTIKKGGFNRSNNYFKNNKPLNGILQQDMKLTSSENGVKLDQKMASNKNNIIISNKANETPSVLMTEEPLAKHLNTEETSEALSKILKEMH